MLIHMIADFGFNKIYISGKIMLRKHLKNNEE